jgi:peptide/nickel transport system substrate-binding protein
MDEGKTQDKGGEMRRWKAALTAVIATAVVAVVSGCGGGGGGASTGASGPPQRGGSVTVANDSEANSLDPTIDDTLAATEVEAELYDPLVFESGDKFEPALAVSWDHPSPLKYIFHLRKGVEFQDGTPFNAQAVKWNLDQERAPNSGSSWQQDLAAIKDIKTPDPSTVEIDLSEPYSPLLDVLANRPGYMRSPTAVRKYGDKFASNPVGTGPFKFVEWVKNDHLTLAKNPNYWDKGLPYLDKVIFKPIIDPTSKMNALISGQADMVDYVPVNLISKAQGDSSLVTEQKPPPPNVVVYMPINTTTAPFNDPKVRQAVEYGINRDSIVKSVVFGAGEPAKSQLSSTSWGLTDSVPDIPYDPNRAKQLLGGKQYNVEIEVPPTYPDVAQIVAQNLGDVGINAKLVRMDWGTLVDNYYKGNYQMQVEDLLGETRTDPSGPLNGFFFKNGGLNGTGYSDATSTKLLNEGLRVEDQSKRAQAYTELQKHAQTTAQYVPLYHPDTVRAWSDQLGGVTIPLNGFIYLRSVWRQQ